MNPRIVFILVKLHKKYSQYFLIGIINDTIQDLSPEKDKAEYEGMEIWTLGFSKTSTRCILFTSPKLYEKTTTKIKTEL